MRMVDNNQTATLINFMSPRDVEALVQRVIRQEMQKFYEGIQPKADPLVKRADAAKMLGVSLPTLDNYAKHGLLHAKHVGGRVYFLESEILSYKEVHRV